MQIKKYKTELAIQEIKVVEKISYSEARPKVVSLTPTVGISYAQVTHSGRDNISEIITQLTPEITSIVKNILQDSSIQLLSH